MASAHARRRDNTAKRQVLTDPGLRKLLVETNELDLQLYEYAADTLYPAQWERSGCPSVEEGCWERRRVLFPVRYRLNRWYSNVIYKTLARRRGPNVVTR